MTYYLMERKIKKGKKNEMIEEGNLLRRHVSRSRAGTGTVRLYTCICLGDMALGHVLVLVQCDWPSLRELLYLTLHRIKMKQVVGPHGWI